MDESSTQMDADLAAKQEQLQERKFKAAVRWLMGDKRGRLFVYKLLEQAGLYRTSYRKNGDTNFLEGARNEGLKLLATVEEYCPGSYLEMLKENRLKSQPHRRHESEREF